MRPKAVLVHVNSLSPPIHYTEHNAVVYRLKPQFEFSLHPIIML